MPDPLILQYHDQQAPAFRGFAYIIFDELPLADFNNQIPELFFEVTRKANLPIDPSVEHLVESINMIPGSGEFVYDTIIQYKTITNHENIEINKSKINSYNFANIFNSVYSLNQLKIICPNIKWIAPVICWFASSIEAENCIIEPAVEFNDISSTTSEEWRVASYNRMNAKVISKDEKGRPRYGGTPTDSSIIRYLQEIKSRNIKIMFYPMFFIDIARKPWRGHLTAQSTAEISDFFHKSQGYNEFILHYANLVKDYVDAFVIGSELIGLTRVNDNNQFPAVDELVNLAARVKAIIILIIPLMISKV